MSQREVTANICLIKIGPIFLFMLCYCKWSHTQGISQLQRPMDTWSVYKESSFCIKVENFYSNIHADILTICLTPLSVYFLVYGVQGRIRCCCTLKFLYVLGNTCFWSWMTKTGFKQVFIAHLSLTFMTNKSECPDCICYTRKTLSAH
jgi:hypothetical protein